MADGDRDSGHSAPAYGTSRYVGLGGPAAGLHEGDDFTYEMSGGRLCVDFANTGYNQWGEGRRERLTSYGRLVSWARQAGLLDAGGATALAAAAARRPDDAARVLERARTLRTLLRSVFERVAHGRPVDEPALGALNAEVAATQGRQRLVPADGGFALAPDADPAALDGMLVPVVRSAIDLLTSNDLPDLRECGADDCAWLFMDATRNRSRRWCDMRSCGNRMKVRRHRQRLRGEA